MRDDDLWLTAFVYAGGLLIAFLVTRQVLQKLTAAGDAVGGGIGNAIVSAGGLDETDVRVNAAAILPGGKVVTFDEIIKAGSGLKNDMFSWQGVRYKLTGSRADSGYYAERA